MSKSDSLERFLGSESPTYQAGLDRFHAQKNGRRSSSTSFEEVEFWSLRERQWRKQAVRSGLPEQTRCIGGWEYGGLRVDQARRLKDLEAENTRLKKLVADLSLDKMILAEASKVRF